MALILRCGEIVMGCEEEVRATTEAGIMRDAAKHAREAHGLNELDGATIAKVKRAIRTSEAPTAQR